MPNYQQGKIYKVKAGDECYIGSTTDKINQRLSCHKSNYKNRKDKNTATVFILFERYGVENCIIETIELYPCNNKEELFERERYWIENTEECVNKNKPNLTDERKKTYRHIINKKYREAHREELNKRSAEYRKNNVDKIEQKQSEKVACECGKTVRRDYLKKHKALCQKKLPQ